MQAIKDITNPTIEEIKSLIESKTRKIEQFKKLQNTGSCVSGLVTRLESDITYLQSRLP